MGINMNIRGFGPHRNIVRDAGPGGSAACRHWASGAKFHLVTIETHTYAQYHPLLALLIGVTPTFYMLPCRVEGPVLEHSKAKGRAKEVGIRIGPSGYYAHQQRNLISI